MEANSLTYQTLKNVSYGFISFGVPILLSILVTPIVVSHLGVTDYGIYILANSIIGFLGLTDLGLTGALTKHIALYHSRQEFLNLKRSMDSANSLFFIIGLLGAAVFFILGKFFLPIFKINGASESHIFIVFVLAGLTFFFNAVNSVYTVIPAALQRFDIVTKLNLGQLFFFSFSALGLVLMGYQLKAVMLFNLLSVIAVTMAYRFYSRRLISGLALGFAWVKPEIKRLYSFGLFSSMASIGLGALNNLDRLLIPAFLGPVQLSYYSLPGNVAQKTAMLIGSVSNMFFPLATSVSALGEITRLGKIYRKIIRNLSVIAAATTVSIALFGYKILLFWLGKDFAVNGFVVLQILAATFFILALFGNAYHFLMGMGKEKFLAKWSIIMAVINLILLVVLIKPWGIIGAAWAYFLGVIPVFYLLYYMEKNIFNLENIFGFYAKLTAKLSATAAVYFIILYYLVMPRVTSMLSLIIAGPLAVLFYILLYRLFGFFEAEDLGIFSSFLGKILERFGIRNST